MENQTEKNMGSGVETGVRKALQDCRNIGIHDPRDSK